MEIYFDNSASTKVDPRVVEAMLPYFGEHYGNASSMHTFGRNAGQAVTDAREKVAKLINAQPGEVVFTGGGSEADNLAIKGVAFWYQHNRPLPAGKRYHIITSPIEHPAVKKTCEYLQKMGFDVTVLPVDGCGVVDIKDLENAIRPETILVSIMYANNEIGTVQDVAAIGKLAKGKGVLFHTDAVQALGKSKIDVKAQNIDLMAMASHKIHGPKGVGALYVRRGVKIEPLIHGGGHEFGLRASTENTPGIVGFGKACELCLSEMDADVKRMIKLRDQLIDGILSSIPDSVLNGHRTDRLPNNVNIGMRYIEGEGILLNLDMLGIAVSTGSACSSKSLEPSHVLLAIGEKHEEAHGSIRITLGRFSTQEEVDYLLKELPPIIQKLREMSPLYKGAK